MLRKNVKSRLEQFQVCIFAEIVFGVRCTLIFSFHQIVGGTVASWLVRSTPEWAVRVRALAGDIVLCSWARHLTLTVPLTTQVYKWVPANLMLGVTLLWTSIPSRGGVEILLVASCYRNWDKLRPGGPHWPVCRLYLYLSSNNACTGN